MDRISLESEIWKGVSGFESLYEVSNMGRVWSVKRNQFLKPCNCNGYRVVCLCNNGERKMVYVHRIVLMTFVPNVDTTLEVNHINEDTADNRLENLEWITHLDNVNWGTSKKRMLETKVKQGRVNPEHIGMDHHEQMRRWQVENRERYMAYQKAYNAGRRAQRRAERRRRDEQQGREYFY